MTKQWKEPEPYPMGSRWFYAPPNDFMLFVLDAKIRRLTAAHEQLWEEVKDCYADPDHEGYALAVRQADYINELIERGNEMIANRRPTS